MLEAERRVLGIDDCEVSKEKILILLDEFTSLIDRRRANVVCVNIDAELQRLREKAGKKNAVTMIVSGVHEDSGVTKVYKSTLQHLAY